MIIIIENNYSNHNCESSNYIICNHTINDYYIYVYVCISIMHIIIKMCRQRKINKAF